MDSLSFAAMRVSATQIAEAFKGNLDSAASDRITAKLLAYLASASSAPEDAGARVMLLGALAAVSPDSVRSLIDHDIQH